MFKKISSIDKIKSFVISIDSLFLQNLDNEIWDIEKTIGKGSELYSVNEFIAWNESDRTVFYNVFNKNKFATNEFRLLDLRISLHNFYGLNPVNKSELLKFNSNKNSFEIIFKNYQWEMITEYDSNTIVFYLNKFVSILNINSGEYEWQTDLSSYGTIRKILGVCGENLWVTTSDKTEHSFSNKLLALSIETGTVLYVIDNDYTFDANWVQLLEKEEKIVSIKGSSNQATYLYEYCGKKGTELRKQTIDSLESNGLSIICAKVVENKVYFTATDHTQIVANHVGVMVLETLEVVWFDKVSPGNLKLEPPQVGADKIYVLGAEGTLHIYEREL